MDVLLKANQWKLNKLHEIAWRRAYKDTVMSFEDLQIKNYTSTIHCRNGQSLLIKIYKAKYNFCGRNSSKLLVRNNSCNIWFESELLGPSVNTVFKR